MTDDHGHRERFLPGLGRRLRRAREEKGFTQAEVAERAGLTEEQISAYESGKITTPSPDRLRTLASVLSISSATLAGLFSADQEGTDIKVGNEIDDEYRALRDQIALFGWKIGGKEESPAGVRQQFREGTSSFPGMKERFAGGATEKAALRAFLKELVKEEESTEPEGGSN